MASLKDREIFKVGTWRGSSRVEATKEFLAHMVQSYTELNSQVPGFAIPLKLGHNKRVGEPAFGYAENVRLSEDGGTVLADFEDVPPEIVDQITKKQYNTVSVEIWPTVEYQGKTYPNVLSGIALLGAEWPAVKGLKPLSMFADNGEPQLLSQEEEMKTFTEVEHETAMAAAVTAALASAAAEHATALAAAEKRATDAEAEVASFKNAKEKADVTSVIEAAEKAGKIVPANKPAVLAMAEAIRLSVDPAKKAEAMTAFSAFVEALPVRADFSEAGKSEQRPEGSDETASVKLDKAVKAHMAANKTDYRTAMDAVFAADPELKTAYAEETR